MTKKQEQARRVFANYCNKCNPAIGGAQKASQDGKQYVCTYFMACRYNESVDGLKASEKAEDFKKYIDEIGAVWSQPYCIDDIKPLESTESPLCTLGASGILYNYEALKKMLNTFSSKFETFGISQDSKLMGKKINALYIKDVDGNEGFILAMRPLKD